MGSETDFEGDANLKDNKYHVKYHDKQWDDAAGNQSTAVLSQPLPSNDGGIPYVGLLVLAVAGIYLLKLK